MSECNHIYLKNCTDLHSLWMYNMMQKFVISRFTCVIEVSKILKSDWLGPKICYPQDCLVTSKNLSIFISSDNSISKLLQSDWTKVFYAITKKIFRKPRKPCSWSLLLQILTKANFSKKLFSCAKNYSRESEEEVVK